MSLFVFVIFINKKMSKDYTAWTNIGYLTAMLQKNGFNTKVCFYELGDNQYEIAAKDVNALNPDFIGLSILQDSYHYSIEFAKEIKKINSSVKIIAGNIISTIYYQHILENEDSIDYISLGEGEYSLPDLCKSLIAGINVSNCKGIAYRDKHKNIIKNDFCVIDDLNSLPFPDRSFMGKNHNFYPIIGSRGCQGHCTFCESNVISKCIYRKRTVENLVNEILMLINEYNCKYISFMDPTFYEHNDRIEQLYSKLKENDIWVQFFANFRSENITESNIDLIMKLQQVGLEKIFIGIEAGNNDDLKLYGKLASIKDNENAINLLHNYGFMDGSLGVEVNFGFINFNPYTTTYKLNDNIEFIKRNRLNITPESFQRRLAISGGCPITKKVINDGLLTQDINKPIINPFCYRFVDENIKRIYNIAHYFNSRFHIPEVGNLICLYGRIKHFGLNEKKDDMFLHYYNSYREKITKFTINNYMDIININKNDDIKLMFKHIDKECELFKKEIFDLYNHLLFYKNTFTKRLLKAGELVY